MATRGRGRGLLSALPPKPGQLWRSVTGSGTESAYVWSDWFFDAPSITGSGGSSFGFSTSGTGSETFTGTGSETFTFSQGATGGSWSDTSRLGYLRLGYARLGAEDPPPASAGPSPVSGSGGSTFGFSLSGSGSETFTGTGGSAFGFSESGTGQLKFIGSGGSAFGFAESGSGTNTPPARTGTGAVTFTFAESGTGTVGSAPAITGTGDATFTFSLSATGTVALADQGGVGRVRGHLTAPLPPRANTGSGGASFGFSVAANAINDEAIFLLGLTDEALVYGVM